MNKITKNIVALTLLALGTTTIANAQVSSQKIGTNPTVKDPSAVLEVEHASKGTLLTRVALTSTTVAAPITAPANALTVFNTATTGDVTPGYYYWSTAASKWIRLLTNNDQDLRLIGENNHITQDAGVGNNGTSAGTTGSNNIGIGFQVLSNNTEGSDNTIVGNYAMINNTISAHNTAIGEGSLHDLSGFGGANSAVGTTSMFSLINGTSNSSFGAQSLYSLQTGDLNAGIGSSAISQLVNGNFNIGLGHQAGRNLISGNSNIFIGYETTPNVSVTGSNQLNIGNWIYGDNGKIGLGTALIPTNQLHIKGATNPVRFEGLQTGTATDNIVTVDANGVLTKTATALSAVDTTNDAWINNPANTRVELGTTSTGASRTAGTEFVALDNGKVGIGTNVPTANLHIADAAGMALFPTTNGSGLSINLSSATLNTSLDPNSSYGETIRLSVDNTYTKQNVQAGNALAESAAGSTLNLNRIRGLFGQGAHRGSGTVAQLFGGDLSVFNVGTGTATSARGLYTNINNTSTGTITDAYGTFSVISNTGAGTITNAYGNYIGNIAGTNKWSLYATDATAPSYFAGSTGIGTTAGVAPTNKLHVVATANPVRFEGLQAGLATDNVVVADATGVLKTIAASTLTNDWHITGNTATNPGVAALGATVDGNFIGTTDAQSLIIGVQNKKVGLFDINGNIAFGANPTITGATNSFLVGANNTSTTNGVAFGDSNILAGAGGSPATSRPFAFGNSNTVTGNRAFAAGNSNVITGSYATAFGSGNTSTNGVSFNYTFLQGQGNTITSPTLSAFAKALGESNVINGADTRHATAFGQSNQISSLHGFALGFTNTVSGIYGKAFGTFLNTASFNETAFGQYNAITTGSSSAWVGTDAYFQIGSGQSEATRANALTILKNGNIGTDIAIAPTERLDVGSNGVRVRDINLPAYAGSATDNIVVADANGVLKTIAASTSTAIRTEAADYTALLTDETILVNASAADVTITLPATPTIGKRYVVKKVDTSTNKVIVVGNAGGIDGHATVTGTLAWQGWVFQWDGNDWYVISRI